MRWLVTGSNGMLGSDLCKVLAEHGQEVTPLGSAGCDIRDLNAVQAAVQGHHVVVNAAAWTAVDDAEANEEAAFSVNAVGAYNVARAAREARARTVQISTDYVFDGATSSAYLPNHPQSPCSAYGRTKTAGEWAVQSIDPTSIVVRTAWLYGEHGPNFVKTMLRLSKEREVVSVVSDQTGQPTWTRDLSEFIFRLVESSVPGGFYHGTNSGEVSRDHFARMIFKLAGLDPARVIPCSSEDFPLPARRPMYSVLAHDPGDPPMRSWGEALQDYLRLDAAN